MSDPNTAGVAPPRGIVWTLGALSMFGPLSSDMYLPGLPSLTRNLHASASAGQLTLTGSVLGIALGQLVAGPVSDSLGRTRPLLAGLIGFSVASTLCAISPSIWPLIVFRLIQGVCGGVGIVIARTIVRDLFSGTQAARMFALLQVMAGIAPILAPLVGGELLVFTSWRGIFVALALIGTLLTVLAWVRVPETIAPAMRRRGGLPEALLTFARLLRDRDFAPYAAAFGLSFGAMFCYIAGGAYALENVYRISPQLFSVVFAANSLMLVSSSQFSRHVVGRLGPRALLRYGLGGVALGAAEVAVVCATRADIWLLLLGLALVVGANGLVLPNAVAAAMHGRPEALGSASGLLGLAQFGVAAAVAPLVGLAGPRDPLPMGILMVLCGGLALAINLVFSRARSATARTPVP